MPATWGGSDGEVGAVAAEHPVEQALALARLLARLPVFRADPLDDADRLAAALRSLGDSAWPAATASPGAAIPDVAAWRRGWLSTGEGGPALLAATQAAARWMREAGEGDIARPEPQQALFLAAVLLKRRRRLAQVPLVFWSGARPGERLPRPTRDPAGWSLLFLARMATAARKGPAASGTAWRRLLAGTRPHYLVSPLHRFPSHRMAKVELMVQGLGP